MPPQPWRTAPAGVVHDDVQPAVASGDPRDERLDVGGVPHVASAERGTGRRLSLVPPAGHQGDAFR
jgi:hypothetical protein